MPGLDRQLQADWSGGMYRSVAPELIPDIGAWDIYNGLLTEDGAVYRRGSALAIGAPTVFTTAPWILWDGTLATGGQATYAFFNTGGGKVIGPTYSGTGAGLAQTQGGRVVVYNGTMYLPGGATFDGTTVGTATQVASYYAIVADRLLAASGNTVAFSDLGTPGTFTPTNFWLMETPIIGLYGLRDAAMVFTTGGIMLIRNMGLNLTDADGNQQQVLDRYSSEIVLWKDSGIAPFAGGLIVPGTDAIWMIQLGVASEAPLGFQQISGPIQNLYREYVRQGCVPGQAAVHNGHYLLPILLGTTVIDMLVCKIEAPERPWTRLGDYGGSMRALTVRVNPGSRKPELIGANRTGGLSTLSYFSPDSTTDTDIPPTGSPAGYKWHIITRDYTTGRYVPNTVMKLRASYQLQDRDNLDPTIQSYLLSDRPSTVGTLWDQFVWDTGTWEAGLGTQTALSSVLTGAAPEDEFGIHPFTWRVGRKLRHVRFQLVCDATASYLSLRALELFVRSDGRI